MVAIPFFRPKAFLGEFERRLEIGDHDHLDRMMLCQIVADSDTDLATLAAIDRHKGRLGGIVVKNGVRLGAILGAEPTGGFAADGLIDMCD